MEETRTQVKINCDLGLLSLLGAIKQFKNTYKFTPRWYTIEFSIEAILIAAELSKRVKNSFIKYLFAGKTYPNITFVINRSFDADYWELIGYNYELDKKFIIYSEGA